MDLVCWFDSKQNKHSFYRGKDSIKRFCSELKELGTKIVNYEQKEMTPLTSDGAGEVKDNATYVEKRFFMIKNKERYLNYTKM